jgi:23S rRNA (uracil1939-C5)-methyltransferase
MSNPRTEILELRLESMAHGGEAMGRDPHGRIVFVPYAIAGERARVEIVESRRGFARGRLVELLEASPARVTPRCPHFPPTDVPPIPSSQSDLAVARGCGGCQWQHIAYAEQLQFKTGIVREQFARIAHIPDAPVLEMLPASSPWQYRNNMQFILNAEGELCLNAFESHRPVPIRECYIMAPPLQSLFRTLELAPESFDRVTLRAGENTGERFVILESDDPETPELELDEPVSISFRAAGVTVPLVGKTALTERVGDHVFRISPNSFFQVNTQMARILVNEVAGVLHVRPGDVLLDAYCGVGLFGVSLAAQVGRVIGIESSIETIDDARHNTAELLNIELHAGTVERVLPGLEGEIDLAVVDPPRAGMERAALDALALKRPRAIAYVSCDPATLARDVARLAAHGYRLVRVQPLDLFPQTYHIECVTGLELN